MPGAAPPTTRPCQYRQTVLTAFQQVEDALAAARVLQDEQTLRAAAADQAEQIVTIT